MDGKGWKPEYGVTLEGKTILGFVEALPKSARQELLSTVEVFCRSQGYVSLHDSLALKLEEKQEQDERQQAGGSQLARVIPILRARRKLG